MQLALCFSLVLNLTSRSIEEIISLLEGDPNKKGEYDAETLYSPFVLYKKFLKDILLRSFVGLDIKDQQKDCGYKNK